MKKGAKHTAQLVQYAQLTGGINTADSPDRIAAGEMTQCQNLLYEEGTHQLMARGGLTEYATLPGAIHSLYADGDTKVIFVFLTDKRAYRFDGTSSTYIGTLTGESVPCCCKFQNQLWIASGGTLQTYDYSASLALAGDAPAADLVFERFGRLCAARIGSDNIYYSAVGDGTSWAVDVNDESMGGWLEIGYGDSGDILSVVPLATDLMIIKSNGNIYQFSGDSSPDTWQVNRIATGTDPAGASCAENVGAGVVFLSRRGLKSLTAVMDYGNIAERDIGDKFASLILGAQYEPRFFSLRRAGILLVRAHEDRRRLLAFHPALGAATELVFALPIDALAETKDGRIIASGEKLYRWEQSALTDAGEAIAYRLSLRQLRASSRLLVRSVDVRLSAAQSGQATVSTGTLSLIVPTDQRMKVRCNHQTDTLALVVAGTAPFTFEEIAVEVAEL